MMSDAKSKLPIVIWILRVIVAAIFIMAGFPKLAGDAGSIAMFEILGAEPLGRYGAGALEMLAAILILIPALSIIGALLASVTMLGAIGAHITKLGISINPDQFESAQALRDAGLEGPAMFVMAIVVLGASLALVVLQREFISAMLNRNPAAVSE